MAKSNKTSNNKNKMKKSTQSNIEIGNTHLSNETSKVIKCILVVAVIFVLMYVITVLILKNAPYEHAKDDVKTSIQYDEILAGTSFLLPSSVLKINGNIFVWLSSAKMVDTPQIINMLPKINPN